MYSRLYSIHSNRIVLPGQCLKQMLVHLRQRFLLHLHSAILRSIVSRVEALQRLQCEGYAMITSTLSHEDFARRRYWRTHRHI